MGYGVGLRPVSLALILSPLLLPLVGGCGVSNGQPRHRVGALPFPGPFTLYRAADPVQLGPHRYGRTPRFFQADERERGIIYTTRAGFLDLAHLRLAIDWTGYYGRRVRAALEAGDAQFALPTLDGATFHVTLRYPHDWHDLENAQRAVLADELAIRCGQRLAYQMLTWHELITWFGHRRVPLIDESPSAFTYDDTMSHVVGLRVAERALRADGGTREDEDAAVTFALRSELVALGAVAPGQTDRAARAVEGFWWSRGKPLKRQLDIGLSDDTVRPWIVRGLRFAPDIEPQPFYLPSLGDVNGRDFSGFCSIRIDPNIPEAARMRAALPGAPRQFTGERDLPLLLAHVRRTMRERLDADVDVPGSPPLPTARPASVVARHTAW